MLKAMIKEKLMPIKLITGNTFKCVSERVFDEIKANGMSEGRHIVIIPDQFTLLSEMEVLEHLGLKSSFNIEVTGFSRLASKVLGDRGLKMLNQVTSVMLLKRVIMESESELNCYSRVCRKAGYVSEIYAVITNMRNSKITPEQLRKTASNTFGLIADKLKDIALLYDKYIKLLATSYGDMGSELENLAIEIPNLDWVKNTHIYVVDFHELTKVKLDILSAFIEYSRSFTMGIVDMPNAKNSRIYPNYLVKFLLAEADKNNAKVNRVDVLENLPKESLEVSDRLYSYNLQTDIKSEGHFNIKVADNLTHEVRSIAREIRGLIVDKNYRYRDIVIVASDTDLYKKIIAKEFADFAIPVYLDDKTNLSNTAIAKLLVYASEAVIKSLRKSEIIRLSKLDILGLSADDINAFEHYINKFNINYSRFSTSFTIAKDDELFLGAEKVREKLISILSPLMKNAASASEHICNINEFYKLAITDSYSAYICKLNSVDKRMAKVAEKAKEKTENCMLQIESLFEGISFSFEDVLQIILAAFSSIEIATIPQYVDSVFVGQVNKSKYQKTKVMFVIGASDGTYPNESVNGGIISQQELQILQDKGMQFFPNFKEKILLDKFYICQLLLKASDKVIITYNTQAGEPSIMARQVARIAGVTAKGFVAEGSTLNETACDLAAKIATKQNAITMLMNYYSERMNGVNIADESIYDYLYTKLKGDFNYQYLRADGAITHVMPNEDAWRIVGGKTFASVSAIERYFECPFKFFCQRLLKLNHPVTGELKPNDIGSFIHKIAEVYFRENTDTSIADDIRDSIVLSICKGAINTAEFEDIARSMTETAIKKLLFDKAVYIIAHLVKCQAQSQFTVSGTEVGFGGSQDIRPALEIDLDGKKYYMRGVIDRVDKHGEYTVIIDYKSKSSMDFGIKQVFYGERVQLFLYLNALQSCEKLQPLAVYYMPMPYNYKNPDKKNPDYSYVGFTRDIEDELQLFDNEYMNKNRCTPVSLTRKGELDSSKLYTNQDFSNLQKYSNDVISNAISEINSGYIEPKPIGEACKYCDYSGICTQKGNTAASRSYAGVAMENDDE